MGNVTGNEKYREKMAFYDSEPDSDPGLQHMVWDGTPFIAESYTGAIRSKRWLTMTGWLFVEFGKEAWPTHSHAGNWHRGGATINGWTDIGFATAEMLERFQEAWPNPEGLEAYSLLTED